MNIDVELEFITDNADKITVYDNGTVRDYYPQEEGYKKIICGWKSMLDGAHEMPAFGVSLNDYTLKEMQNGLWVEFVFGCEYSHNEMPFQKLLVKVMDSYQGFNIIRFTSQHGYDGRCFYFDLVNKNMAEFNEILVNL